MSGSLFRYDSPVSYMLGVIAEKLSGKPFLEFLKERFLIDIGFSKILIVLNAREVIRSEIPESCVRHSTFSASLVL